MIRKKYTAEEDELARKELENLISIYQEMMTELEKVLANADVTGMTDADREVLQQKIDDLKKQIAALKGEKPTGDDKKYGDDLDVLGFSSKQWEDLFKNLSDGKMSAGLGRSYRDDRDRNGKCLFHCFKFNDRH